MRNFKHIKSYSQGGEDLVLYRLLKDKKKGFFIDVGANKPIHFNNTYLFYKIGWRGINFEAIPDLAEKFQKVRPHDIVINKAISNFVGEAEFSAGINKYHVNSSLLLNDIPQQVIKVTVDKLEDILDTMSIEEIDFISIDTEGTEIDVLEGLNLNKYRPRFILVEYNTASNANNKLQPYLINNGYQTIFINAWNMIFSDNFSKDVITCYELKKYNFNYILRCIKYMFFKLFMSK